MDCTFASYPLSPVGKELPKEYEGHRSKPACVPKGDQNTGDYRNQAEIVNNSIDILLETFSVPPDHMLCVGGLWQEHWSRICRAKVCLHNPMIHLHHLVLLIFCNPKLGHWRQRGIVGGRRPWLLAKKNLGRNMKRSLSTRREPTRPALRLATVIRAREAKRRVRRGIFVTNNEDKLKIWRLSRANFIQNPWNYHDFK